MLHAARRTPHAGRSRSRSVSPAGCRPSDFERHGAGLCFCALGTDRARALSRVLQRLLGSAPHAARGLQDKRLRALSNRTEVHAHSGRIGPRPSRVCSSACWARRSRRAVGRRHKRLPEERSGCVRFAGAVSCVLRGTIHARSRWDRPLRDGAVRRRARGTGRRAVDRIRAPGQLPPSRRRRQAPCRKSRPSGAVPEISAVRRRAGITARPARFAFRFRFRGRGGCRTLRPGACRSARPR